jgi:triacylglycerol lipase
VNRTKRFGLPILVALMMAIGLLAPTGASASVHDPILFVHGWSGSSSNWDNLKTRFTTAGWASKELATINYGTTTSNKTVASQIGTAVNSLLSANPGATKVDLISHSMGGLSTRYYVKSLGGESKVKTYISLAGANHGTSSANACSFFSTSCKEMVPGSAFLSALNSGDETPGAISYATWWSPNDGTINPATSTILSGADNTQIAGVSHMAFLTNATVGDAVVSYVAAH